MPAAMGIFHVEDASRFAADVERIAVLILSAVALEVPSGPFSPELRSISSEGGAMKTKRRADLINPDIVKLRRLAKSNVICPLGMPVGPGVGGGRGGESFAQENRRCT
jgi:hypothetical protein